MVPSLKLEQPPVVNLIKPKLKSDLKLRILTVLLASPLYFSDRNADEKLMARCYRFLHSNLWTGMVLICTSLLFSGCGKISSQIEATFKRPSIQDFKKSEIISNGPGIADGQSELLVVIQLMNSDGSIVKLFRPTYEIVSGTGVTASACTTSNNNGVSTCVLKSAQAGTKRISVTNIEIPLQADVVFNQPPAGKPNFGLAVANKMQIQGAHTLTATIGNQEPGAVRTSGTYKLFGGVQGEAFSR